MRVHLIDASGAVVNVVVAGGGYVPPDGLTIGPEGGEIGDVWDGQRYIAEQPVQTPLTASDYAAAIQAHIDAAARGRGYGDGALLSSYINSSVSQWAAEAASFVAGRDAIWLYAYEILAEVQSGQRPPPSMTDFLSNLPQFTWPTA